MACIADDRNDIIEIELIKGNHGLGFNILGGKDTPHLEDDPGIFVAKVRDLGAAKEDGRLQEGDKIIAVNGNSLQNVTHQEAVVFFQNAGTTVRLNVESGAEAKIKEKQGLEAKAKSRRHGTVSLLGSPIVMLTGTATIGLALILGYRYLRNTGTNS